MAQMFLEMENIGPVPDEARGSFLQTAGCLLKYRYFNSGTARRGMMNYMNVSYIFKNHESFGGR